MDLHSGKRNLMRSSSQYHFKPSIRNCYLSEVTKLHLKEKYKLIGVRLLNLSESSYPMGPLGSTGYMHQQTESTIDSGLSSHPVQVRRKQGIVHHRTHHTQVSTNKYAKTHTHVRGIQKSLQTSTRL